MDPIHANRRRHSPTRMELRDGAQLRRVFETTVMRLDARDTDDRTRPRGLRPSVEGTVIFSHVNKCPVTLPSI